jgi:hypothetical protein
LNTFDPTQLDVLGTTQQDGAANSAQTELLPSYSALKNSWTSPTYFSPWEQEMRRSESDPSDSREIYYPQRDILPTSHADEAMSTRLEHNLEM